MLPILLSIFWFITFINQSGVYHNIQITIPTGCTESTLGYGWATLINYVLPNGTSYIGGVFYVETYESCPGIIGSPGIGYGYVECPSPGYGLTVTSSYNSKLGIVFDTVNSPYPIIISFQNGTKALVYPSTWWYYLINMPGYVQAMYQFYQAILSWPFNIPPPGPIYYGCFDVDYLPNPYEMYTWYYYPLVAKVYVGDQPYMIYTTTPNKIGPLPGIPLNTSVSTITGLGVSPINQSVPVGTYAVVNITEYGNAYIPPTLVFAGSQYCMYMPHIGLTEDMPGKYNGIVFASGYLTNFTITFYQPTTTTTHLPTPSISNVLVTVVLLLIIILIVAAVYTIIRRKYGHVGVRL